MPIIVQGLITILIGVGGCVGYFYLSNLALDKVIFPAKETPSRRLVGAIICLIIPLGLLFFLYVGPTVFGALGIGFLALSDVSTISALLAVAVFLVATFLLFKAFNTLFPAKGSSVGDNINRANAVRPWLFLFPAIFVLGLYLVYPVVGSFWRSLFGRNPNDFVGFGNYVSLAQSPDFRISFFNNFLWAIVVPAASTFLGLLVAQLTDKLSWGNIAKSLIFMPMAISFVGASLIWKFVYANDADIGLINAVRAMFGFDNPIDVLQIPFWNNFFLMVILIWIQTGFAMVILSAALRGIPEETIEAAILDGANPWQLFFKIKVPQIMATIVVVWTTITILVLKVFDIVYTMTGGNFGTEILPSYMMDFMFRDDGRATAIAFVIMLVVLPVMVWNIIEARKETR